MPDEQRPEFDIPRSSDDELCALIHRSGAQSAVGRAAYGELYRRYRDAALSRALRIEHDPRRAEDAVAEAFAKTLQAMSRGFGPKESFVGYLFTAVRGETYRRSAIDRVTGTYDETELENLPEFSSPDPLTVHSDVEQLQRAFAELPGSQQQLLWLVEVDELSVQGAGSRVGMSRSATASALLRAREALRTAFLQQYAHRAAPGCRESAQHLAAYVRGGLGRRLTKQVRDHLDECEACAAQISRLTWLNEGLKTLFWPAMVGGATALVGSAAGVEPARAAQTAKIAETTGFAERMRLAGLWLVGAAGATCIMLGLILFFWPGGTQFEGGPEPTVEAGVEPRPEADRETEPVRPTAPNEGSPRPWEDDRTPYWIVID